MGKTLEVTAEFDKDTKRKKRYSVNVLGIDISIYIDRALEEVPEEIHIKIGR